MFGLVLNALRARRAQTVALFALTVLAALGASTAPWFAAWARDAVVDANISGARPEQRVVAAQGSVRYGPDSPDPLQALRDRVRQSLDIPGAPVVVGARLFATMYAGTGQVGLYLNYRDGVCEQLTIAGACPRTADEVLLSRSTAEALGLRVGDPVRFEGFRLATPVPLRVSGLYDVTDLLGTYWAGTDLLTGPAALLGTVVEDPAFVSREGLVATRPDGLDMDFHLVVPDDRFRGGDIDLAALLTRATGELRQASFEVKTEAPGLIDQIARDRRLVALGIGVAAAELVLLCWIGLFLAVRHTSDERRGDIGLLKLRGAATWRIWALTAQQSGAPMVAGAVAGWLLGYVAAVVLAGALIGPGAIGLSLAAAGVAGLGGLAASVVAEWRTLGAPVIALLRRVPGRHRGWRADALDAVVVLLAAAGVYQGHAELTGDGEPSALALLAPVLVGLAVALLVARALPVVSAVVGRSALRAGRPGAALAALHLARRPGTNRMFAVLAVAVSVFGTGLLYWHTATGAWSERAVQELGADRVLTVRAAGSAQLLRAVRAADPEGRYAMAVARTNGVRTEDRVVAVDTTRLARVARVPDAAELARRLRPTPPADVSMVDGPVTLEADGPTGLAPDESVALTIHLSTVDGKPREVAFGPLTPGPHRYQAMVADCPGGCRLVGLEVVAPRLLSAARPASFTILGLTGLAPQALADVTRWRAPLSPVGIGTIVAAHNGQLRISLYSGPPPPGRRVDPRILVNAAPSPLPIVLAGARPEQRRAGDDRVTVLGGTRVPYQVVAEAPVLPRVGAAGALTDLEYAQRSNDASGETAALEVWLTGDAPDSVVDAITAAGVQILRTDTVDGRTAELARHGPGVALRFQLLAAFVLLLLAAGTLVVASTVELPGRAEELRALRAQGLLGRQVALAGHAGSLALVGVAGLTGVASALLADVLVTAALPVFADGWDLLPLPRAVLLPLAAAGFASLVVLGMAAAVGANRLTESVRHG